MLRIFFVLLISFLTSNTIASHITGGGFQLIHKKGFSYSLSLYMYVDAVHVTPGVIESETFANASIFSKSNNLQVNQIALPRVSRNSLLYLNDCKSIHFKSELLEFKETILMDPSVYNDPAGYYIVYERCCRPETFINIEDPETTGITIYLEVPPVYLNSVLFRNSSPILPLLYDSYSCVGRNLF